VAVRVGMAAVKTERDRRSARARRAAQRQFGLLPEERLSDGVKRMALAQIDLAISQLEGDRRATGADNTIHEVRKALKRLRALMRLLRDELGDAGFARENAILRDAGLRLAGARDAEVLVNTLDGLMKAHRKRLSRRRGVAKLRGQLMAERHRATERGRSDIAARAEVLGELRALRGRVENWSLPDRGDIEIVEPGLQRIYRQGRRRRLTAARGKGAKGQAMHDWRKRVKDLRYAAEMLDRKQPRRRKGGRRGKRDELVHELARRADELGELLGEEHDLAVLAERLGSGSRTGTQKRLEIGGGTRGMLLKLIRRRRRNLRRKAIRRGESLYRRRPKRFVGRVRAAYARSSGG
jgi:CHAD domain-containing protein